MNDAIKVEIFNILKKISVNLIDMTKIHGCFSKFNLKLNILRNIQ